MGANTFNTRCQDRVKPGQCNACVGSLYAFIYMQMYFCIFPYQCHRACVSAARATHGACPPLAPLPFTCCQNCISTCTWRIHGSRAAARLVPRCLQVWWQGPCAHRPAACLSGWAQPLQMCTGLLLTHPMALIPQDRHAAETRLGGEGQRQPRSPLSPELHWGCSIQFSPSGLSPAPWGALCDIIGWLLPPPLAMVPAWGGDR